MDHVKSLMRTVPTVVPVDVSSALRDSNIDGTRESAFQNADQELSITTNNNNVSVAVLIAQAVVKTEHVTSVLPDTPSTLN